MIENKGFTPGPWSVNSDPMYCQGRPYDIWGPLGPGHGIVANVAPWCPPLPGTEEFDRVAANARLIAAAPEMYEALQAIEVLLRGSSCVAAHSYAVAALAKAEDRK